MESSIVDVEQGRECCVARQSRSDVDDYEVRSEDLDDQGKVVRSVEVDERLTRDEVHMKRVMTKAKERCAIIELRYA